MKFFAWLEKKRATYFLIIASFIFFLLRLPSLFEPYWYGDEGIYEVIGNGLRHGRLLYTTIWDNKPPLLYYIFAFFSGNQDAVRAFSLIVGIATFITFFFVAQKLFNTEKAQFIATGIFGFLFATPILEGNIANAENFMLLPILLSALIILKIIFHTHHKPSVHSYKPLVLSGFLLGFAFLLKVVAVFDFAAFFIFLFFATYHNVKHIRNQIPLLASFLGGFGIPIAWTFLWFLVHGRIKDFIVSAFLSNVGYVNYGNTFIIPQGLLIIKVLLLGACIIFLFKKRHIISLQSIFILLWLAFSIFNALFSQRGYTHYLLVILSSFSLGIGYIMYNKKFIRPIIAFLVLVGIIELISLGYYYGNFLMLVAQQKTYRQYIASFDKVATVRDYTLAEYINLHKKSGDSLFVWGDSGQLYGLTHMTPPGKYIVKYHMISSRQSLLETAQALKKVSPTFVVILPKQGYPPYGLNNYHIVFSINDAYIYEKVF